MLQEPAAGRAFEENNLCGKVARTGVGAMARAKHGQSIHEPTRRSAGHHPSLHTLLPLLLAAQSNHSHCGGSGDAPPLQCTGCPVSSH